MKGLSSLTLGFASLLVLVFSTSLLAQPALPPGKGLKAQADKSVLKSSGAIVVNGKVYEKVVLSADSKGAIDWDYDEDAFPDTRVEMCVLEKKLILFPIAKGQYRLRLLLWEEKQFQKITLVITGDTPPLPPIPPVVPPVIPPTPTPIKEVLGFTTLARAELAKLSAEARTLTPRIADNFEAVAAKLAATSSMTVDEANAMLRDRQRETLGALRDAWIPWFTAWKVKADSLNENGTLVSREDYVKAYLETSAGLR